MQPKQIEFAKLRHAYETVKYFLETEGYNQVTSLDNKVEADLGLKGDDSIELLEKFVSKFELDHQNFDYDKHFHSEEEKAESGNALTNLLTLSVWLPLKTIELLTFNKVQIDKPSFPVPPSREVANLTFKDLITWYIEKEFTLSDQITNQVKAAKQED